MSLNEMIDSNWRSTDSNSDIVHDESITETINGEFDLLDKKNSDIFTIKTICNIQNDKENKDVVVVEEELFNAMNNLQIDSVKKLQHFRHPMMYNKNSSQDNDKQVDHNETSEVENISPEVMQPEIDHMRNKAMKLMSTLSPRKVAEAVSPSLPLQLKSRVNTLNNRSISNRVVKTISNTDNCVQLKEEKINFFGIPVTTNRKKRTQVKPFNFQNRTKKNQQLQKPYMSIVPQKLACPCQMATLTTGTVSRPARNNAKINEANKTPSSTIVSQKMEQTVSEIGLPKLQSGCHKNVTMRKCAAKIIEENDMTINNIIGGQEIKSMQAAVGQKLSTDRRQQFKAKIKQRELEMEKMRARVEQKKRDREKLEENIRRKRVEIKGKPMPEF